MKSRAKKSYGPKERVSFKIYVFLTRGQGGPRQSKYWWRVYVHPSQEAMYAWVDTNRSVPLPQPYFGLCSVPSNTERRKDGCIGELNFFYPNVGPGIFTHELMHAVLDTLAYLKHKDLVPPKFYTTNQWSTADPKAVKKIKMWSARQERAAYMMDRFMAQIRDALIEHDIWYPCK